MAQRNNRGNRVFKINSLCSVFSVHPLLSLWLIGFFKQPQSKGGVGPRYDNAKQNAERKKNEIQITTQSHPLPKILTNLEP